MRKKILFTLTALALVGSLTACGSQTDNKINENNNTSVVQSENPETKGDGSLIPKTVTIDGVEYTKESTVNDLLSNGWTIHEAEGTDIATQGQYTMYNSEDKEITVDIVVNDTAIKDSFIAGFTVVNILSSNDLDCSFSNGVAMEESHDIIDEIYKSVKDEMTVMEQNGVARTEYVDYRNEEGVVSYAYFDDEEMGKDKVITMGIYWY